MMNQVFLGNEFSEYLHEKQIPLNANALGDHHASGIIDNFAGIIKQMINSLVFKQQ